MYTGRILNSSKISAAEESSIPSQILMAEPVCIIFLRYIFADNAFWSILVRNDTYFGNCGAANSPPYIRSRSLRTEAGDIMVGFIPVYMGLECINTYYKTIREWLIPVYTGQILLNANIVGLLKVHPRVYGANTKSLGEVSMLGKPLFPFALDFRNRTSMYHFRQPYFCG